jgi:hypothetical protein
MKQSKFSVEFQEFVYYALLAFILLLTQNLLFQPKLDFLLLFALCCFAVAIPFLATNLMVLFFKRHTPPDFTDDWYRKWGKYLPTVLFVSLGSGSLGIFAVFAHINIYIGILYSLSVSICLFIINKFTKQK